MNEFNFPVDHIGIAVTDLTKSIELYCVTFGHRLELREEVPSQGVEVAFLDTGNTKIELLAATRSDCTLAKFLSNRGAGLHHICYRVADIRAELKKLEQAGHQLIDKAPRPGAHNTEIAFISPKAFGGVLIELCATR